LSWERHLEHWIVGRRFSWLDWLFIDLSWIGSLGAIWLAIAALLMVLWRRPSIFVTVLVAVAGSDLLAEAGKLIVQRHRPFETQLGPPSNAYSFPSGHTATSFAAATVLSFYAPRWRVPFFLLATLIGLSRIYNGMHYPTDVLAGALLGVLVALLILQVAPRTGRRLWRGNGAP
jgi:undecaprenyl-diphosphatase